MQPESGAIAVAQQPLSLVGWTALCAVAEAIGMTAAAAAAKGSQALIGEPANSREVVEALSIAVAGGLVEGVALGGLQALGMGRLLPDLNRPQWVLVTTAVAGVGWAGARRQPQAPAETTGPPRHRCSSSARRSSLARCWARC